ncbi:hypothetical protein [Shouchella lehensis]|uniref:Uncharacterized protein n=2 Tax=Shouchella lehensis TaxID=300825 RepID=A0A060LVK1_9BACI|nr:hypothetical protein [Shouchella lehensis]AIC95291.1 hypothetical protein BleG1_2726 [Shouchella lehensis G1]MBG9783907.1 hypothetical protein [Shouchella lehensis]TES51129.1 hypothetical protein E2L03_04185 [Shouchella lehensis]
MKRVIGMLLLILLSFSQVSEKAVAVSGNELMDAFSIRITVVEEDVEYQWEFDNPNHYEYEKGTKVLKGDHAKIQVIKMTSLLQLDQDKTAEQYKKVLKPYYPEMSSFEIRWMDAHSERYIWSWEK